jgi:hypothetical protein
MLTHLEQGDVAETIAHFFEASTAVQPAPKSVAVNLNTRLSKPLKSHLLLSDNIFLLTTNFFTSIFPSSYFSNSLLGP